MRAVLIALSIATGCAFCAAPVGARTLDGQAIYREQCRNCHGARGAPPQRARAQYKEIPTIDSAFMTARSEDSIVAVLRRGVGRDMKSFTEKLSPDEMRAVARFLRTLVQPAKPAP